MKWLNKFFTTSQKKVIPEQVLSNVDGKIIEIGKGEILLFAILRNESLRLAHFIAYYKSLGVDWFFVVDNNSTDNSKEIILNEPRAHLFFTEESYKNHWYWMEYLLEMYGKDHWCLVVDIDELFAYPNYESIKLPTMINFLENSNYEAIRCFLLDMYSINEIVANRNNPLEILNYFDKYYYETDFTFQNKKTHLPYIFKIFEGGMRERVFGKTNPPHILSKVPFFRYTSKSYLSQGMHAIDNNVLADIQGVVFHTKFLSDFIDEVKEETLRGQHYGNAFYYKHYLEIIQKNESMTYHNEDSIKYQDSKQLIELDLMKTSEQFESFCKKS